MAVVVQNDEQFMNLFLLLAEGKTETRIESCENLLKHVNDLTQGDRPIYVEYTFKRLIRGLASSREWARQGFSMALTSVLRDFKFSSDELFTSMGELLKTSYQDPKRDQNNTLVGRVMFYLSILQSDNIGKVSESDLKSMVDDVLKMAEKKPPMIEMCFETLNVLIEKVDRVAFKEIVYPSLKTELTCGWKNCEANTLSLLITSVRHHKKCVNGKFLKEHWGSKNLLSDKAKEHIGTIVAKSCSMHPLVHPVCFKIIEYAAVVDDLSLVWKVLLEELVRADTKRKYLCLKLVPAALAVAKTKDDISSILSPNLVSMLLYAVKAAKDSPLLPAVKHLCVKLEEVVAAMTDSDMQMEVITCLLQVRGGLQFDSNTSTNTLPSLVRALNKDAARAFVALCLDVLRGKKTIGVDAEIQYQQQWACQFLPKVIANPHLTDPTGIHLEVLGFLLFHSYFTVKEIKKGIPNCDVKLDIQNEFGAKMKKTFHKYLHNIAVLNSSVKGKTQFISVLHKLAMYTDKLLSEKDALEQLTPIGEEELSVFKKAVMKVDEMSANTGVDSAFKLLLLHVLICFLENPADTVDIIKDVLVCYEKAHKKAVNSKKKAPDEHAWIDVLTELLLSLLADESHLTRTVVNSVFKEVCSSFTPSSIDLLSRALQSSGDDEMVTFEDSDDEEELENGHDVNEEGNADESSSSESEEDESDSDEEIDEEMDIDKDTVEAVKSALGNAAAESDDEGSSDDVDDEEMFKLDESLAAAFRAMRKGKKTEREKEKQILRFKLRLLDLIEILAESEINCVMIIPLLEPLFLEHAAALANTKTTEIGHKTAKAISSLCSMKYKGQEAVDGEEMMVILNTFMDACRKGNSLQAVPHVAKACLFVIRIYLSSFKKTADDFLKEEKKLDEEDIVTKVTVTLKSAMQDYCSKRDSALGLLFVNMIEKQPEYFWPLLDDIINYIKSDDVRIFIKTKLLQLLGSILTKRLCSKMSEDAVKMVAEHILDLGNDIINVEVEGSSIRPKVCCEILNLVLRLSPMVSKITMLKIFPETLKTNLPLLRTKSNNKELKGCCKRVLTQIGVSSQDSQGKKRAAPQDVQTSKNKKKKKKTTS